MKCATYAASLDLQGDRCLLFVTEERANWKKRALKDSRHRLKLDCPS